MEDRSKRLVIMDPGLRELAGHHPGTAQAIANALAGKSDLTIELFAHSELPKEFSQELVGNIQVHHFFKTDFYRYFYQSASKPEALHYLRELAREYYQLMLSILTSQSSNQQILFWCHTLNWQHARALATALGLVKQQIESEQFSRLSVIAGAMYSPYSAASKQELELIRFKMQYELAFRALSSYSCVTLCAADYELKLQYQQLLNKQISLQPCLLLNASQRITELPEHQQAKEHQVILFSGDAKLNKGFTKLPGIAAELLNACSTVKLVIQYSITNDSDQLAHVEQQLMELAQKHDNLAVINRFLSHEELMNLFKASSAMLFNYHEETYQHQSSGVLWLAAYFNLKIICMTHTWVNREAVRLGLSTQYCSNRQALMQYVQQEATGNKEASSAPQYPSDYRQALFKNVAAWLNQHFK